MLQRPVPLNILASQQGKIVAAPKVFRRRSPQAQLGTLFRSLGFSVGVGEAKEISTAWARGFLLIQNQDVNPLFIEFGRPATLLSYMLLGGGEFKADKVVPCNSINVFSVAGCSAAVIIEG